MNKESIRIGEPGCSVSQGGKTALVLSGGIAKGAFEAGALKVLAASGVRTSRIVATSSGGLNALLYAAGTRVGKEREAAETLANTWIEEGHWSTFLQPSLSEIVAGRGFSRTDRLSSFIERIADAFANHSGIHPHLGAHYVRPVVLQFVISSLCGAERRLGDQDYTQFETVLGFDSTDFATQEGRQRLYNATVASAAFPLLFAPVKVDGVGEALDGGTVNNTPIQHALADAEVRRLIVIVPEPADLSGSCDNLGLRGLLSRLYLMLTMERLNRDLADVERRNAELDAPIQLIVIRPSTALPGTPFTGFFDRQLRQDYVTAGEQAALAALDTYRIA
jgi:NTE family protein